MTDNKKIAEQVLAAVGGAANLKDATHCMTRLRLYLKDDSLPKDDEVKKISGVLGVVRGGQQYQIVIGMFRKCMRNCASWQASAPAPPSRMMLLPSRMPPSPNGS